MSGGIDDKKFVAEQFKNLNKMADRMRVEVLCSRAMEVALRDNIRDLLAKLVSAEASLMAAHRDIGVLKSSLCELTRYTVDDNTMAVWADGEWSVCPRCGVENLVIRVAD